MARNDRCACSFGAKRQKSASLAEPIHHWTHEPVSSALRRGLGRLARVPGVVHLAVMPDVYQAEHIGAGLVLGAEGWIFPEAVGGDIGCGVATLRLRGDPAIIAEGGAGPGVLRDLGRMVPILRHPGSRAPALPEGLPSASGPGAQALLERHGCAQLGTLGRGNVLRGPDGAYLRALNEDCTLFDRRTAPPIYQATRLD